MIHKLSYSLIQVACMCPHVLINVKNAHGKNRELTPFKDYYFIGMVMGGVELVSFVFEQILLPGGGE